MDARGPDQRLSAVPLLILAAIDLVVALVLLVDSRFSVAFFAIAAIGIALAVIGFLKLFRQPTA